MTWLRLLIRFGDNLRKGSVKVLWIVARFKLARRFLNALGALVFRVPIF